MRNVLSRINRCGRLLESTTKKELPYEFAMSKGGVYTHSTGTYKTREELEAKLPPCHLIVYQYCPGNYEREDEDNE